MEELLKYVAVRRVLFKDRVCDCGGLLVYGLAAGAGFAAAENLQYTLLYGAGITYARMILSIPLHCCTGLIIGIHLGYRKFLGKNFFCPVALAIPILIHGTYDFVLFLPASTNVEFPTRLLIVLTVLVCSFAYCRLAWLPLDDVCVVNVRSNMKKGLVSRPLCCCCECDCCSNWFMHRDPLVPIDSANRQPQLVAPVLPPMTLERSNSKQTVGNLARSVTQELLPLGPIPCQAVRTKCPACRHSVYAHVLFESFCPHCGAKVTETAPKGAPRNGVRAEDIEDVNAPPILACHASSSDEDSSH